MDELIAVHSAAEALGEKLQDVELAVRERNGSRRTCRNASGEIDRNSAQLDEIDDARRPPEHSADSREQFLHVERLRDVIISPQPRVLEACPSASHGLTGR